jgi:solute:Na+ symporter, SSS family
MDVLDYGVIALYGLLVIYIGWRSARRTHAPEDLFLASRGLGFSVVGLSLFASNISSTTLIGLSGAAYESGIAVVNYEWMAGLVLLFAAFFLVPVYLRSKLRTVPEFVGQRFGSFAQKYVAALMIALSILVDTAGSLFAGALVIQVFMPGIDMMATVLALAFFAAAYTITGGLRAVMLTDALQAIILIMSSVVIAILVFAQFDFSWEQMQAVIPAENLSLVRPMDDPNMPWTGLLTGVPILGLYYWTMNHYIAQRFLAARDLPSAQRGALLAAALKLTPLFIMVLPGALAVGLYPELARGDEVYPTLIRELLPAGLKGLALAGIIAAIMSTVDSTINAASAMISYDFVGIDRQRNQSASRQLLEARLITAGLLLLAVLWAPVIDRFPGLFNYLQQMFAVAAPPVAAVILLAALRPGLGESRALAAMISGHVLALVLVVASNIGVWPLHFLETAGVVFVYSLVVMASAGTAPRRSDARVTGEVLDWRLSWSQADRGLKWGAMLILAGMVLTLIAFA